MKLNLNVILLIIIFLLIGAGFLGYNYMNDKVDDANIELRKERIKNDTLEILADGQARKLVADTLTIQELNRKIDSLDIELEGRPTGVTGIGIQPVDTVKVTDTIIVNEGVAYIEDYYPNKENYFLKYTNEFSLDEPIGNSKFEWSQIDIDLIISENEDGTFESNMRAPKFIKINSLDVQTLPMRQTERDKFGILVGAGYGRDFATQTDYLEVGGGIRINKFYIEIEGNTNKQADLGFKFEF